MKTMKGKFAILFMIAVMVVSAVMPSSVYAASSKTSVYTTSQLNALQKTANTKMKTQSGTKIKTSTKTTTQKVKDAKKASKSYAKTVKNNVKTSSAKTIKISSTVSVKQTTTKWTTVKNVYTKGSFYHQEKTTVKMTIQETATVKSQVKWLDVNKTVPKADTVLREAFVKMGFKIKYDPSYDIGNAQGGRFEVAKGTIFLNRMEDHIYHEMGHFLAFMAGNYDMTAEFGKVFNAEKAKYANAKIINGVNIHFNYNYVTKNQAEYFAESYMEYVLYKTDLQKERPETYKAIEKALKKLTPAQISRMQLDLKLYK